MCSATWFTLWMYVSSTFKERTHFFLNKTIVLLRAIRTCEHITATSRDSGSGIDAHLYAVTTELRRLLNFEYSATRGGVLSFLEGFGSNVCQLFDSLLNDEHDLLPQITAYFLLEQWFRMVELIALQDPRNAPRSAKIPSVLSRKLHWALHSFIKFRMENKKE